MPADTSGRAAFVWSRVVPAPGRSRALLERAEWLTPYTAAAIADDALHAGRGARLEVTLARDATDSAVGRLRREFAWLGTRGVEVSISRRGQAAGLR
jgi:hypothetical protein